MHNEDLRIDNTDLKILQEFSKLDEKEYISSWKMMRKIFKEGGDSENMKLKKRIKRLLQFELFIIESKEKKNEKYLINTDKVILNIFTFPTRRKKGIAININNKWRIFEL